MKCPKCGKSLTVIETSEGVTVDFCQGCYGIWFDKDEIGFYLELGSDMPDLDEALKTANKTDHECPKCASKLEELLYAGKSEVKIDRCPSCEGIWTDKGEIAKLEEMSAGLQSPKSRVLQVARILKQRGYESFIKK